MPLVLLTTLTMIAFAANSILTRIAVDADLMDPFSFAVLRIMAGAVILALIVLTRNRPWPVLNTARLKGAISLTLYVIGFTLAYLTLDAGLGALILFGVVQMVMFAHSALSGQSPSARQLSGAALAFGGLVIVLWPGEGAVTEPKGAALMVLAGVGWAVYTLSGRAAFDPLATTALHFILCLPMVIVACLALYILGYVDVSLTLPGLGIAVLCGGATSGLGYALWYHVLPQIRPANAAVVQLSVPIIAICIGSIILAEPISWIIVIAAALVLGGIGWALTAKNNA